MGRTEDLNGENQNTSVGTVEKHVLALSLPEGGFALEEGGRLERVEVAWEGCGLEKPEQDNVVFICHALTGDAHVAGRYAGEEASSGWWDGIVGPGKTIDTNRYRVICANVLGGCKGTTGPASENPATGKPYGSAFPRFTIGDTVEVYRALLRELGVKKLAYLVGGSFGGIQVIEWIAAHPGEVERAVMIASGAALNSQALAFDIVGRYAITLDPNWHGGDYYGSPDGGPKVGLAQARQVAHITYLSLDLLNRRFGRKQQEDWLAKGKDWLEKHAANFGTTFAIESYLGYQAKKFLARFDANSYLQITHAMDRYDATVKYGSLEELCGRIESKLLLVSISGDWLFSEEQSKTIARGMLAAGKSVSYAHLDVKVGHDGFLTHTKELARIMGGFFRGEEPEIEPERKRKLEALMEMIPGGMRVLDIGCGRGFLLRMLKGRGDSGTGIDIDHGKISKAIAYGADVLYEDADDGLGLIPDGAYGMAVLSETLQTVKKPREILLRILEKADRAVVTIPNFAAIGIRMHLAFTGRMPVGRELPFEWYDTPNTHFFTYRDFRALCAQEGIEILEARGEASGWFGRLLVKLGLVNLGADRVIALIARKNPERG